MSGLEDEFLVNVVRLAKTTGWLVSHHKQSVQLIRDKNMKVVGRRSNLVGDKGLPDLVLIHADRARVMFRELKRNLGPKGGGDDVSLTPEQVMWGAAIDRIESRLHVAFNPPAGFTHAAAGGVPIVSFGIWRPSMLEDIIVRELSS